MGVIIEAYAIMAMAESDKAVASATTKPKDCDNPH